MEPRSKQTDWANQLEKLFAVLQKQVSCCFLLFQITGHPVKVIGKQCDIFLILKGATLWSLPGSYFRCHTCVHIILPILSIATASDHPPTTKLFFQHTSSLGVPCQKAKCALIGQLTQTRASTAHHANSIFVVPSSQLHIYHKYH